MPENTNQLDLNYGTSEKEKTYVQDTLEKEGVKSLFSKETKNLHEKIIKNFHNDNYLNFETNKKFDTEKENMKKIINEDPTIKTKYENALNIQKGKPGVSE